MKSESSTTSKNESRPELKLELSKGRAEETKADVLVVFATKKVEPKKAGKGDKKSLSSAKAHVEGLRADLSNELEQLVGESDEASSGAFTGGASETVFFRQQGIGSTRHLLVIGLGESKSFEIETLRQAAAHIMGQLKAQKCKSATIHPDTVPQTTAPGDVWMQALVEGLHLSAYQFAEFKAADKSTAVERINLVSSTRPKSFEKGLQTGEVIAEAVNFARFLGDMPGNRMTPTLLGEQAQMAAKGTKLKVSVWDKAKIKQEKMGSFLSVSLGSSQEPKFIVMEYKGAANSKKPIVFVGKGLTFDSGGISIKPSAGMEEMKYDMCGGAAVIAALTAIAKLKLKVNAVGLVPATENMPGPSANKPGDIVIARNGKSIEVNNTDAEGRLILNDALSYACELDPAVILDAATLTGAMAVALGNLHTGYFTRNDKLATKIATAAGETSEWVWRMPLTDFHAKDMKGTYADLSNISSGKGAGSATAAAFLEQFVEKEIPWAHFDIAGTAWHTGDRWPYNPRKGASGVMVRTFVQFAMNE